MSDEKITVPNKQIIKVLVLTPKRKPIRVKPIGSQSIRLKKILLDRVNARPEKRLTAIQDREFLEGVLVGSAHYEASHVLQLVMDSDYVALEEVEEIEERRAPSCFNSPDHDSLKGK